MAQIDLDLATNVQDSIKEIEKFARESSKSLGGVEDSFKNLEGSAKQFATSATQNASSFQTVLTGIKVAAGAALAVFAGRKIVDFFSESIGAAEQQEKSLQTLNTALALNGDYSEEASKHFVEFANSLQDTTGFSDDTALSLVALAKSFGATNAQAEQIVRTSVNYAAVNKTSVEATVEGLSKSLNGFKSALFKTTKELNGFTEDQRRAGAVIDFLDGRYKDAAATLNKTFSGSVIRVGNSFEDLQKSIGSIITKNPVIIAGINAIAEALNSATKFVQNNKKALIDFTVNAVDKFGAVVISTIKKIGFLIDFFDGLKLTLSGVGVLFSSLLELITFFANNVISGFSRVVSVGFLPLIKAIELAASALSKLGLIPKEVVSDLSGITKALKQTILSGNDALGSVVDVLDDVRVASKETFTATFNDVGKTGKSFDKAADSTQNFLNRIKSVGIEASKAAEIFDKLNSGASKGTEDFEAQAKAIEENFKSLNSLKEELKKAQDQKNPIQAAVKEQAERTKIIKDALSNGLLTEKEYADLRAQINIDGADKVAKETDKINKERLEKEKKRQEDFINSLKKATSEGLASPLITTSQAQAVTGGAKEGSFTSENAGAISQVTGALSSVLQGAAGATKLVQSAIGTIADTLLPGIGGAVSEIVGVLAQGPEKVKGFIEEFAKALPEVIKNINLAIPVVIQTLADHADEIIIAIVKNLPEVIRALVKAMPGVAKALAVELPGELIKALIKGVADNLKIKLPTFKFPDFPAFKFPELPKFAFPSLPSFSFPPLPSFSFPPLPSFSFPELPKFSFPALPSFSFPSLPSFSFPKLPTFEFPKLPTFKFPELPTFKFPELPTLKLPEFPTLKIDTSGLPGGSGGGGGALGQLGGAVSKVFKFAGGGQPPEGFPNDSFPSLISSGENVIDKTLNNKLEAFLNNQNRASQTTQQPSKIVLQIGEKQLAEVLLNINRQGFRTA